MVVRAHVPTGGRPKGLPFVAFTVLLMFALLACGGGGPGRSAGGGVAFQRLDQNESYTADLVAPAIFVARSGADVRRFSGLTAGGDSVLAKVEFDTTLVVAVFRGQVPSGGHGIAVTSVAAGGEVRVAVELTSPDGAASDVLAYPYELVTVDKAAVPAPTRWVMVGPGGSILAETRA